MDRYIYIHRQINRKKDWILTTISKDKQNYMSWKGIDSQIDRYKYQERQITIQLARKIDRKVKQNYMCCRGIDCKQIDRQIIDIKKIFILTILRKEKKYNQIDRQKGQTKFHELERNSQMNRLIE